MKGREREEEVGPKEFGFNIRQLIVIFKPNKTLIFVAPMRESC